MNEPKKLDDDEKPGEFSRFQKLARALFRVDKRDVPKHEPKKRPVRQPAGEGSE